MTFASVGSAFQASAAFSLTPGGVGDLIIVELLSESATVYATALTSTNVTWTVLVSHTYLSDQGVYCTVFIGKATSTSAATVTPTFSGSTPGFAVAGKEFSTTAGYAAVTLDTSGTVNTSTASCPSLTPGHGSGELYFCFTADGSASAGSTSGYTYFEDTFSNGLCYNAACGSGAQAPTWANSGAKSGIAVLLYEATSGESGSFTPTLPKPSTSLSGKVVHKGSLTIPLPTLIASIASIPHESGSFNITLPIVRTSLGGGTAAPLAGTYKWNGSLWVPYQLGTDGIAAAAVTANKIAANTITAQQIAANTITATQIAANTITGAQIAATTITGSLIAANTITGTNIAAGTIAANLLVSGIVVAGIVDSTTITTANLNGGVITGARIVADGSSGEILVYSGTPTSGNLVLSLSAVSGTDGFSNPYGSGLEIISSGGSKLQLYDSGTAAVMTGLSGASSEASPTTLSMAVFSQGLSNESIQMQLRGPESTYDSGAVAIILASSANDGSTIYVGTLEVGGSAAATWGPGTLGTALSLPHQLLLGSGASGGSQIEMTGSIHVGGSVIIGSGSFPVSAPSPAAAIAPIGSWTSLQQAWASSITNIVNDIRANLLSAGVFM